MDKYQKLKQFVEALEDDFQKFFVKSNKAAGTRLRKSMQDLKALAQEIRVEIQGKKNVE
jgi:hypothetical protein